MAGRQAAARPDRPGPPGRAALSGVGAGVVVGVAALADAAEVEAVLLGDAELELLRDLPSVLDELNAELDAVQQALKDVRPENAELTQRLDRLESKRGLFNRK